MANDPDNKDDKRAGSLAPGSKPDGSQVPPRMQPVRSREIVEPPGALKANDSLAFRSDTPRDVAMPSSTSSFKIAEISKTQLSAFKSDAPRETRDHAMLASSSDDLLRISRPLTHIELSAFKSAAPRDTAMLSSSKSVGPEVRAREPARAASRPKPNLFSRLWQVLRRVIGSNRSE